ncbi:DUF192 domain-containing protein [Halomonas beimenensis]|uniref:DUF192 domain-containing protein n=1 Tax=Halomonas beimenensis TaxID=475662 RepID=UPI0031CEC445
MPETSVSSPTRRRLLQALVLLPAAACWAPAALAQESRLPGTVLTLHAETGPHRLRVELARTLAERGRGLMERDTLAEDAGMLFLYDRRQPPRNGFWMYRTRIPLDIAFLDESGRILEIHRMTPCRAETAGACPVTRPASPYRAALEVNAGYFAERGIGPGDCVSWPGDAGSCRGPEQTVTTTSGQ